MPGGVHGARLWSHRRSVSAQGAGTNGGATFARAGQGKKSLLTRQLGEERDDRAENETTEERRRLSAERRRKKAGERKHLQHWTATLPNGELYRIPQTKSQNPTHPDPQVLGKLRARNHFYQITFQQNFFQIT